MTNMEKFEEIYGFPPNINPCIIPKTICPAEKSAFPAQVCANCKYQYWWDNQYTKYVEGE